MRSVLLLLAVTIATQPAAPVLGLQRPGVHLAVGAGGGVGSWNISVDGRKEHSGQSSFATDFAFGYQVSPNVAVYYLQKTTWFNSDVTILPSESGGPATQQVVGRVLTQGLSGAGVTYSLAQTGRGLQLSGGIGLAWWSQVFEESTDCVKMPLVIPCADVSGIGAMLSAGYYVSRRLGVELASMWGAPSLESGLRFQVISDSWVLMLLLRFRIL